MKSQRKWQHCGTPLGPWTTKIWKISKWWQFHLPVLCAYLLFQHISVLFLVFPILGPSMIIIIASQVSLRSGSWWHMAELKPVDRSTKDTKGRSIPLLLMTLMFYNDTGWCWYSCLKPKQLHRKIIKHNHVKISSTVPHCSGNRSYKAPHQYDHESNTGNHVSNGNTWQRKQRLCSAYTYASRLRALRIQSYVVTPSVVPSNWSYPPALLIAIVSDPNSWEWSPSTWS